MGQIVNHLNLWSPCLSMRHGAIVIHDIVLWTLILASRKSMLVCVAWGQTGVVRTGRVEGQEIIYTYSEFVQLVFSIF
jgi:hypothetical protein